MAENSKFETRSQVRIKTCVMTMWSNSRLDSFASKNCLSHRYLDNDTPDPTVIKNRPESVPVFLFLT